LLTFQIRRPKVASSSPVRQAQARHSTWAQSTPTQQQEKIRATLLEKNLQNLWFKVGEEVRFKKPKRKPIWGKVVNIVKEPNEVTWSESSGVPMNIILEVPRTDTKSGIQYGTERVKTNVKKLMYGVKRI